jgi:hypothetical protein
MAKFSSAALCAALEESGDVCAAAKRLRVRVPTLLRELRAKGAEGDAARLALADGREARDAEFVAALSDARDAVGILDEVMRGGTPSDSVRMGAAVKRIDIALKLREEYRSRDAAEREGFQIPRFPLAQVGGPPPTPGPLRVVKTELG